MHVTGNYTSQFIARRKDCLERERVFFHVALFKEYSLEVKSGWVICRASAYREKSGKIPVVW